DGHVTGVQTCALPIFPPARDVAGAALDSALRTFKCLATTNIIESPQSGVERRTRNVTRWRDADMVQRWVASAWLLTEKHFRRIEIGRASCRESAEDSE